MERHRRPRIRCDQRKTSTLTLNSLTDLISFQRLEGQIEGRLALIESIANGNESIKKEPIEEDCDAGVKHRIAKGPFLLLFCVFSELELTKRTHPLPYP